MVTIFIAQFVEETTIATDNLLFFSVDFSSQIISLFVQIQRIVLMAYDNSKRANATSLSTMYGR